MSKTILVNNSEPTQLTFSAGQSDLLRLNPGVNEIDAGLFDRVVAAAEKEKEGTGKAGGILVFMEDERVFTVDAKDGAAATKATGKVKLESLNVNQAKEIITAEDDLDVLASLLEEEEAGKARAGVIKAIEDQVAAITAAEEEEGNEE